MPPSPKTTTLENIRALAGNEMLAAMLKEHDELKRLLVEWRALAALAENRKPAWETMEKLLDYAKGLPEAVDLQKEADAVRDERRLLEDSDPMPPVHDKLAKLLRAAVKKAHSAAKECFQREMKALELSANWQKLNNGQREHLLEDARLTPPADLSIGDDPGLMGELSARSLAAWATAADALPERFRQVALAAARLLEPKTQRVSLTSGTLKTPEDVTAWLGETESELLEKIKKGPVVVG